MTPKKRLEKYGFCKVGYWKIADRDKEQIKYHLDDEAKEYSDLNYALVKEDKVFYIGSTRGELSERMKNLNSGKNDSAGGTNKKLYEHILSKLSNNFNIEIYALTNSDFNNYNDLKVSLASGIEYSLIKEFDNGDLLNKWGVNQN